MFKNYFFIRKIKILFGNTDFKEIYFLFFGILLMGFFEIIGVFSIAPFMAVILNPDIISESKYLSFIYDALNIDIDNDSEFIFFLGAGVILVLLISNTFQVYINWKILDFVNIQSHKISARLLSNYLDQPYSFFLNKNTSEMSKNILSEVSRGMQGVVLQLLVVLAKLIIVLFIFILLLWVNSTIALVATIVLFGSYGVIHTVVKNKVSLIGQKLTDANYQVYKSATEALSSIKYIKVRGSEVGFVKSFYGPSEEIAGYQTKSHMFSLVPRYILEVIIFGGMIIIVMTLGGENSEIIPVVSLYAMAGYRLMPAIQSIYSGIISIKYNISAFDLLVSDLSKSDESKEMNFKLKKHTLKFNHKIELKDINYTYLGANHSIINKLNLTIEKNTVVGIVGTTGSGKTTLVDILLGLLSPSAGYIKLDETRLGKNNISNWQSDVGYVPQSVYLLDGSIRRNIAFGIPNDKINEDQIIRVAKMASLHDFILSLPEKYDTLVGERGVRLSGGQQQRISIARALYHNPSVLMLDEATSALDNVTENTIMDAIHNLAHKKTIIMIAHRLSTIKECDIVHMMDAGTIVASGTYQQLIVDNKDFRAMANAT